MTCEKGRCICCGTQIARPCRDCGSFTNLSEYTEVLLDWSNGSKMSTAVCVACARGPIWKADKKQLTEAIWNAWDKMGHIYDKEVVIV